MLNFPFLETTMSNPGSNSNSTPNTPRSPGRPGRSSSPDSGSIRQLVADQFRETMLRAFWDLMYEQLSTTPPNMETAFQLLSDVKKGLLSLLPKTRKTSLHEQIELHLNLESLKEMATENALDINDLLKKVLVIIGNMCAPARDDKLKEIKTDLEKLPESSDQARNYVTIFKEILGFIDMMTKDQQELLMKQVNPIDLHRAQFQTYLNSGGNPDVLFSWLKEAKSVVENDASIPEDQKTNLKVVFITAFQKLLNLPLNKSLPETIPDEFLERVRFFSVEMQSISLLMSIVLLIKQACGNAAPNLAESIRGILSDPGQNSSIEARLKNISEYAETQFCENLNAQSKNSLKSSLMELAKTDAMKTHPVLKLVNERVTKLCVNSWECAIEKRTMPNLPGIVVSTGCSNDVGYVATDFVNILMQNYVTFEPLYKEIMRKLGVNSEKNSPRRETTSSSSANQEKTEAAVETVHENIEES